MRIAAVSVQLLAESNNLRLDPHYYLTGVASRAILDGIKNPLQLGDCVTKPTRNGFNLGRKHYDSLTDPYLANLLYVSVGALSWGAFRRESATPLFEHRKPVEVVESGEAVSDNDVLITRSGTPGVAWSPGGVQDFNAVSLIPSGFVIRTTFGSGAPLSAGCVAALLNHPVWRLHTLSLSAGKRQRNLSQDALAGVTLPTLTRKAQAALAAENSRFQVFEKRTFEDRQSFEWLCTEIMQGIIDFDLPAPDTSGFVAREVPVYDCFEGNTFRIDGRYHRPDARAIESLVTHSVDLGSLVAGSGPVRGPQPEFLDDDAPSQYRVVATGSIQAGQIDPVDTKPTSRESYLAAKAAGRVIQKGDIVVAMDGEGSVGRAAVVPDNLLATVDSHVAILRLTNPAAGHALAIFLNSTLGQVQVLRRVTGATGQIMLGSDALLRLKVPSEVLRCSSQLSKAFSEHVTSYRTPKQLVLDGLAACSAEVGRILLEAGAFTHPSNGVESALSDSDAVREGLNQSYALGDS